MTASRNQKKRKWLFRHQRGLCHWCKKPMRLLTLPKQNKEIIRDLCTLDHLDDRYDPQRGQFSGERRIVAACWQCNFERNEKRQKELPREVLWERSRSYPTYVRLVDENEPASPIQGAAT